MTTTKKNKSLKNTVKTLATKASKFNPQVLKSSEQLVDNTLATGEKVQDLMEKVLYNGVSILGKQQELTLDTIESIVGQYRDTNDRFKQFIGWGKKEITIQIPLKKQTQKVISTAKNMMNLVQDKADTLLPKVPTKKASAAKATKRKVVKKAKAVNAVNVVKTIKPIKSKKVKAKKDLTIIEGIGPKIANILQKAGIKTFDQLAKTDSTTLKTILAKAGGRYTSHDPSNWAQQAGLAAAGKWEVLAVWKKRLKKGQTTTTSKVVVL